MMRRLALGGKCVRWGATGPASFSATARDREACSPSEPAAAMEQPRTNCRRVISGFQGLVHINQLAAAQNDSRQAHPRLSLGFSSRQAGRDEHFLVLG